MATLEEISRWEYLDVLKANEIQDFKDEIEYLQNKEQADKMKGGR